MTYNYIQECSYFIFKPSFLFLLSEFEFLILITYLTSGFVGMRIVWLLYIIG